MSLAVRDGLGLGSLALFSPTSPKAKSSIRKAEDKIKLNFCATSGARDARAQTPLKQGVKLRSCALFAAAGNLDALRASASTSIFADALYAALTKRILFALEPVRLG